MDEVGVVGIASMLFMATDGETVCGILIVTVWNQIMESLFLNEHTHTLMIL